MQKKSTAEQERTSKKAIIAVVDAIEAINEMIKAKGEQPSTALIAGYITIMTTRVLDDFEKGEE